ncbi:MAG: metallopeptidase family protein [Phycisphaerae bacterium]|nr:metallopeptidase family protein [Phycisphaerae bacterium]
MTPELQARFDALLQDAIAALPPRFRHALEEIPVIVIDRPDAKMLDDLRREGTIPPNGPNPGDQADDEDLMGLHSGIAITERTLSAGGGGLELPPTIHIFREGIVGHAGGWDQEYADDEIYEEIRITLLHELGHHFGLDEDELDELGYA